MPLSAEAARIAQNYDPNGPVNWLEWGPYLSERQWGTVREDYSPDGTAWDYFPHDAARSRAYRWGEDGLAGISDDRQRLCFALALWNGQDSILKERLYGLNNNEGNHGEDVKEYYFYSDNTPTHSYMKWQYKYPQQAFPYSDLVQVNAQRKQPGSHAFEYELLDTGVFNGDRYFDVQVEYAKASPTDILIRVNVVNRGPATAPLRVLPTLWYRNTWSWVVGATKPTVTGTVAQQAGGTASIHATPANNDTSPMVLFCQAPDSLLFCDNETNTHRLFGSSTPPPFPKDGIHDHIVSGSNTVNPALTGTKAAALYNLQIASGQTATLKLRLTADPNLANPFDAVFDATFATRLAEADDFYAALAPPSLTAEQKLLQRQAYAGMLWNKQFYHFIVQDWLDGDAPAQPPPDPARENNPDARNVNWFHLYASNVLAMPDKWEYPWFASWDLCFHAVVFARLDLQFAKQQLLTLTSAWYMSPSGCVPAYEWKFDDANPPLYAWAALRISDIEQELTGGPPDVDFLTEIFDHCLMYFTWWSNRRDSDRNNIFEGGFLGLDNISILDRSNLPPSVQALYQSDGTSWMAMFCLNMMELALMLSKLQQDEYIDFTSKYFQHFVFIADALGNAMKENAGNAAPNLWDDADGFFYDVIKDGGTGNFQVIKLRTLVGFVPLFSQALLDLTRVDPTGATLIQERFAWFKARHADLLSQGTFSAGIPGQPVLLSLVDENQLRRILARAFDPAEFLSPFGIRSISQVYRNPYVLQVQGQAMSVQYEPAEAPSDGPFGGNSNWRGPIWFPINFLIIDALRNFDTLLPPGFTIEYPTGSGQQLTLGDVARDLAGRLVSIFTRGADGKHPVFGGTASFQNDPNWANLFLFYEYFHGDNGAGLGASHQTGWTGLVAELLRIR